MMDMAIFLASVLCCGGGLFIWKNAKCFSQIVMFISAYTYVMLLTVVAVIALYLNCLLAKNVVLKPRCKSQTPCASECSHGSELINSISLHRVS